MAQRLEAHPKTSANERSEWASRESEGRSPSDLIRAAFVDERLEFAAELFREVFVADGVEQRQRRLVGLELRDTSRAFRQMVLQFFVHRGRKLALHEIGEKSHEVLALTHGNTEC